MRFFVTSKQDHYKRDKSLNGAREYLNQLIADGYDNIVIVNGFPKSGNSWLCRLLANYLDCSVSGYLTDMSATELSSVDSADNKKQTILKAHLTCADIKSVESEFNDTVKIINIIRDPRDVCISASAYFYPNVFANSILKMPLLLWVALLITRNNSGKHLWSIAGWNGFYKDVEHGFCVRYEDLLKENHAVLSGFLKKLNGDFNQKKLEKSFQDNSFKKMAENKKDAFTQKLMRKGISGSYKNDMPKLAQDYILKKCTNLCQKFEYS